ncbi:MAG: phosphoribosylanthranilate isomerase [Thermoplasmata archaeon]
MALRPAVKICGIKHYEDAVMIARYEPDMMGVVLDPKVLRSGDEDLIRRMNSLGIPTVGVYTDENSIMHSDLNEDIVQIHFPHGDQIIDYVHSTGRKVISVVNYSGPQNSVLEIKSQKNAGADRVLLERRDGIADVAQDLGSVLQSVTAGLSGRVSASNVRRLLDLNPEFVDLSSSLESSVGQKDPEKVRNFFREFRNHE